jgi:hypothetical protein
MTRKEMIKMIRKMMTQILRGNSSQSFRKLRRMRALSKRRTSMKRLGTNETLLLLQTFLLQQ